MTGDGQCELGVCRVVGMNNGGFFYIFSIVTARTQLQGDFSLSTGRDLPRKRGRCATSAGFNAGNFEFGVSFVDHDVVVVDCLPTHHRLKLKYRFGYKEGRCPGVGGALAEYRKRDQYQKNCPATNVFHVLISQPG